jgi:hypothetical protein
MMDDFRIDARKWRFLDNPARYLEHKTGGLHVEPLARQFRTAKELLKRLANGNGVLLADDVGLGKTTVGALVAWVVACQDKRVRIYAPNDILRRRWAEELERHVPMLNYVGIDAGKGRVKQIGKIRRITSRVEANGIVRLRQGRIQIATHHSFIKSIDNNEQRTACDLMIIDEAHRAKGEDSEFKIALNNPRLRAKRKLILTATPFSIKLAELEQLLRFVGADKFDGVREYAARLKQLHSLGEGHDVGDEARRLVSAAEAAIDDLRPFLIRHGIDDLSASERKHFGSVGDGHWTIPTAPASPDDIALLLRMDRLLHLTSDRNGERRNDPRFHVGWRQLASTLVKAEQANGGSDSVALRHIEAATAALRARRSKPHPKVADVSDAIRPVVAAGEKVLIFCHHRATASELLLALERSLRDASVASAEPPEQVWRGAWESLLRDRERSDENDLTEPIIDWLCTPGLRRQIGGWLDEPATTADTLSIQLTKSRPRNVRFSGVPTISQSAISLKETLLDPQSTSTRALLKAIAGERQTFGGKMSRLPGHLNDGFRVMGAWHPNNHDSLPKTLYTRRPDIVLAIFNSPFGPDVLVTTDYLSEGVDLHRCCRYLIHYELDPSPMRTLQRNGRIRRVGSWASLTGRPIHYAYPTFGGTRDEKAVRIMRQRINAFGLLLGGVPSLDEGSDDSDESFAEQVLRGARKDLESLNRRLCVK